MKQFLGSLLLNADEFLISGPPSRVHGIRERF